MKYVLRFCFIVMLIGFGAGFFIKLALDDADLGDKVIGVSVLFSTFIVMPIFLYHRWKDKDIKDYVLDKEKLDEMRKRNL